MITKKEFEEVKAQYEGVKTMKRRYEQDELSFNLAMNTVSSIIKKYKFDNGDTEERLRVFYDQLHKLFVDSTNELREKRIEFSKAQSEYNEFKEDVEKLHQERLLAKANTKINKAIAALMAVGIPEEAARKIVENKG
jgi:hypothetical protein